MKSKSRLDFAVCAVIAITTAAPAQIAPRAQSLIDKSIAWSGGRPALDGLRTLTFEGTLEVAGLKGSISLRARGDGRQRMEYDLRVTKGLECFDGEAGWARNPSGQIEDLGLEKAAQLRRELDRTFNRHLRGQGVAVSAAGEMEKDGRTWSLLRFDYPGGSRYENLVDPATGESVWSRTTEDGRATWSRMSDLRKVDGVLFAFRQETFGEHAAENQVVTWTRITVNAPLGDDLFARPGAGARLARLAQGRMVGEWLPMELYRERHVFLSGRVNGAVADIVLDSGAGLTTLDRAFAESAGLRAQGAVEARGTGGVAEAGLVQGVTLQVGDLTIGPLTAAVIDLSAVSKGLGRNVSAILGKELFHAMVVDLDYPNARIRFQDPGGFRYDGSGHRLELLAAEGGHKNLRLSMEEGEPVIIGLDTGQGNPLTVFAQYARERGFLNGRPLSESKGGGVGGATISKAATLRSVTLAGFELREVPVAFSQEDIQGAFDTRSQAGNLGAGILTRFRVLFDYAHGCLWLEPGPEQNAPFPRDRAGLTFRRDGDALVVAFVAPGSPAAGAGWREGERVTALDGEPVGPNWWRVTARWTRAADGTTVRLTLADGSLRTLVLKTYY